MLVLPVLDILNGQVVRGVAGHRQEYCQIVSQLTPNSDPFSIACAIRDTFGLVDLYVADLDGIVHRQPRIDLYRHLIADGFRLLVDAGIRHFEEATHLRSQVDVDVVVGLESCRSPDELARIAVQIPNVTFSLDLRRGHPCRASDAEVWASEPIAIIQQVVQSNVNSIIVLDLSDVGMATGGSTDSVCREIRNDFPEVRLVAGGGVRGPHDLVRLSSLGVDAVLVASALHDGRLVRSEIDAILASSPRACSP